MMTVENQLVEKFKRDFLALTNRAVEVKILDKWDELCTFDRSVDLETVLQMIFDATGWTEGDTFRRYKKEELVSRRQIIDLIATCNNVRLLHIAKRTGRNHATVMHSISSAKHLVETDTVYRKLVREVMDFIRVNYGTVYRKEVEGGVSLMLLEDTQLSSSNATQGLRALL